MAALVPDTVSSLPPTARDTLSIVIFTTSRTWYEPLCTAILYLLCISPRFPHFAFLYTGVPSCKLCAEHARFPPSVFVSIAKFFYINAWCAHENAHISGYQVKKAYKSSLGLLSYGQRRDTRTCRDLRRSNHQICPQYTLTSPYSFIQHFQRFLRPRLLPFSSGHIWPNLTVECAKPLSEQLSALAVYFRLWPSLQVGTSYPMRITPSLLIYT